MLNTFLLSINLLSTTCADSTEQNKIVFQDSLTEDVVIRAIRASDNLPVTQFNLDKKEIKEKYFGQDIPFLLQSSPSIVAQSDAGSGMGYSYLRLRGMDYTRINFGINGIPINDPENQGFFSNNFADLSSSAQSIQVQRGVGTTSNGTAPFAGSVNVVTHDLNSARFAGVTAGYGSFNSARLVAEFNSGVTKSGIAIYGRASYLRSDGYRANSGTDLKTFFFSAGYFGKKSILKFNVFGGYTQNQLAFYATDKSVLDTNRRFNSLGSSEKDQFRQFFYQLQYTYKFDYNWSISTSAYYVKGVAPEFALKFNQFPYFYANMPDATDNAGMPISATNMRVSYRLNQDFYGGMAFVSYKDAKLDFSLGMHVNGFSSDHFMEILNADIFPTGYSSGHYAYFNTGYKNEISNFAKLNVYLLPKTILFLDYQLRTASFRYSAQDQPIFRDTFKVDKMQWVFFNPKMGIRQNVNDWLSFYGSFGVTSREPTRFDLMGDDRANFNVKQSDVSPETVYDTEFGADIKTEKLKLSANIYLMEFRNEIAATGALNSFGFGIRKNVGSSFRRGSEISASWMFIPKFTLINNSSFSYNRIKEFTQDHAILDQAGANTFTTKAVTYYDVNPVLTPSAIVNQGIRYEPVKWLNIELTGRYVSKMYLDNTNNEQLTTPEYVVGDIRAALKFGQWIKFGDHTLSFQLNNFTNTLYSPAGTPYNVFVQDDSGNATQQVVSPAYFPAATRNFFVTLSMRF